MEGLASLEKRAFVWAATKMLGKGLLNTGKIAGKVALKTPKAVFNTGKFALSPVSTTVNMFKKPLAEGVKRAAPSAPMVAANAAGSATMFGLGTHIATRGSRIENIKRIQHGIKPIY